MATSGIHYEVHPRTPPPPHPPPHHAYDRAHDDLFDWAKVRRYVVFSLGSVRRRFGLFMSVSSVMLLLAAVALWAMPKTYEVESRLLAQKNSVLAVRADASQATEPTRAAAENIVRHDNLQALIRQTDLLAEWPKHRAPIMRLKDWISLKMGSTPDPKELMQGLTGLLEKNLTVWTTPEGSVVIRLQWPDDKVMAYRLVDAAQQNFLENRHIVEVSTIAEQISILEGHAANQKKEIMKQVDQLQQRSSKEARPVLRAPALKPMDPDVVNLRVMLDAKRRALADLEDYRRKHLVELQTRLAEQRAVYSESHPSIIDLEQSIDSLKRDSPQVLALRQEETDLRQRLSRESDGADDGTAGALAIPAELFRSDRLGEDSAVEYQRAQLRFAVQQYAHLRERMDAGRIDLDTARAAFKYRYSVVVPAQVPRGPIKPKALVVIMAALIAGLLLALFATTAADLRSGVVLETWQLQDLLGPGKAIIEVRTP